MRGRHSGGKRVQQGIHHIILKKKLNLCNTGGVDDSTIDVEKYLFVCDNDKILFLSLLNDLALRFHAGIFAFVLMDTHVHLLIQSKTVSLFIGTLCSRYARIYNKKYIAKGVLFERAFFSIVKEHEQWQVDTILYILNNPIDAGMCRRHLDYFFSSYRQHVGIPTSLSNLIKIDNILINKWFKTTTEFKKALVAKLHYQKEVAHIKYSKRAK